MCQNIFSSSFRQGYEANWWRIYYQQGPFFFLHNASSYSCKLVHIADRSASRFENLFKRSKGNVLGIQTCLPCLCGSICFTIIMLTNHKGWMGGLVKPSNVNNWE